MLKSPDRESASDIAGREKATNGHFNEFGPIVIAILVVVIAVGNLAFPPDLLILLPFDYILVALVGITVVSLFLIPGVRAADSSMIAAGLMLLSFVPGFLSGEQTPYGISKALTFIILIVLLLGVVCFKGREWRFRRVFTYLGVASIASTLAILTLGGAESGRVSVFGLNPIAVGRMAGLLIVLALLVALMSELRAGIKLLVAVAGVGLGTLAVISTGSRGPLLSALIAAGVIVIAALRTRHVRPAYIAVSGVLVAIFSVMGSIFVAVDTAQLEGLSRILGGTDSGRLSLYELTIQQIVANPLGIGWGSLGEKLWQYSAPEGVLYPHNVFLEVLVEGGWIALVGFLTAVLVAYRNAGLWLRSSPRVGASILALLTFALVNAQFSSDVVGNRMLWLALALALAARPVTRAARLTSS